MDGWITYKIMKAQFLKISGHKNEKDFYKEFPTQEAFMAKHGAALKKAQNGNRVDRNNDGVPDSLQDYGMQTMNMAQPYAQYFGGAQMPNQNWSQNASQTFSNFNSGFNTGGGQGFGDMFKGAFSGGDAGNGGLGKAFGDIGKSFGFGGGGGAGGATGAAGATGGAGGATGGGGMSNAGGYIQAIMSVAEGVGALKGEKQMKKNAYRDRDVVQVVRDAYDSKDVNQRQNYMDAAKRVRNAINPTIDPSAFYPVNGVGTNILAKNGGGLSRDKDYGSKSKPYPSVSKGDFAGGGRSYPIPTKADAVDALRLAGLHGRSDVKAKVYAKYPELKKANNGEIMNTYDPYTLYDDLEYESTFQPMTDIEQVKSYLYGGKLTAQNGGAYNWDSLNNTLSTINQNNQMASLSSQYSASGNIGKFDNAGGKIGSGIGQAVGTYFGGPLGGMVGKWAGKYVGGALDPNARKIAGANNMKAEDINYMTNSSKFQGARMGSFGAYTRDGGIMRTGGNLRTNEVGDVEALSGGYLEPISYNPHTSGTGITSMIKGQSHDESNGRHSGVILDYNGNHVEAERGEPISERQDGGSVGDSAVIAGDQTFNKLGSSIMPHLSKYEGKKIKNIQKEIAEKDAKLNKFDAKNTLALNSFEPKTPIDKLTMNSYAKNAEGIQQKYKINAREVDDLLAYQAATNETAELIGANAGDLSRGKIKYETKNTAQTGTKLPAGARGNIRADASYTNTTGLLDYNPVSPDNPNPLFSSDEVYAKFKEDTEKAYDNPEIAKQLVEYFKNYDGPDWQDVRGVINKGRTFEEQRDIAKKLATDHFPGRFHVNISDVTKPTLEVKSPSGEPTASTAPSSKTDNTYEVTPYTGNIFETVAGQIAPWLRRSPGEDLDTRQIAGELGSLGDTPDAVQARFYHPNLRAPYDISYQDQLNANQADFNAIAKQAGDNPEALAALAAQKYSANSKVLGEQFRANQAMKENVYGQNTNTLNDALLKNLSIADQQYVRQSQAKSNTKEVRRAALESIAAKTLQNRLENRKLQVGSNEFKDFSFDGGNRLNKTGAPTSFYIPQVYGQDNKKANKLIIYDANGNIKGYQDPKEIDLKKERNGNIVKAFKNL